MIGKAFKLGLSALIPTLAAIGAFIFAQPTHAQPATWNYSAPANVSTATYPGNVVIGGTCTGCGGVAPPVLFTCGTVPTTTPCLDLTATWATTGTYVGAIRLNVTDSGPANAASLLFDLQVGGASKFNVAKTGLLITQDTIAAQNGGNIQVMSNNGFFKMGASNDVILARDNANVLAQRNSTTNQTFNIYKTFTDNLNYERMALMTGTTVGVSFENAGTGSGRSIGFGSNISGNPAAGAFMQGTALDFWTSTAGNPPTKKLTILSNGHINYQGTAPTISACGGTTTPDSGSTDAAGSFTTGGSASVSCVLTFNSAYSTAPFCVVQNMTVLTNLTSYTVSTSIFTITQPSVTSQKYVYHCFGA